MATTTEAWALSLNLGTRGGTRRYAGTRYHYNDTYKEIQRRGAAVPRVYPATDDGSVDGEPVLLDRSELEDKRRSMGPYVFGCQMLLDPKADETQGFLDKWIEYFMHDTGHEAMNIYILVDAASGKKRESDYTAAMVIGLAPDKHIYILDMVRDRLNLEQRTKMLFELHRRWNPRGVGYEEYGLMADIEHIELEQKNDNYRFDIVKLAGRMPKHDRIRRLIPDFSQGRVLLPQSCMKTDYEGRTHDLVSVFIEEEFKAFPVGAHEDMLDAFARIKDEDMDARWPRSYVPDKAPDKYARPKSKRRHTSAWAA